MPPEEMAGTTVAGSMDKVDITTKVRQRFDRYASWSEAEFVRLRRLPCEGTLASTGDSCPFEARYVMLNDDGGALGWCGFHVPELQKEVAHGEQDAGFSVFDTGELGCDQYTGEGDVVGEEDDPECGCNPFLAVVHASGDEKVYCRRHARVSWMNALRSSGDDDE